MMRLYITWTKGKLGQTEQYKRVHRSKRSEVSFHQGEMVSIKITTLQTAIFS